MKYVKGLTISVLALALTYGAASIIQQLSMGRCAMKGGCIGNVQLSIIIGLYISPFFMVPFLLAMKIFQKGRVQRYRYSFFSMCAASGISSAILTLFSMRIAGIPYDLVLWPIVFFIISSIMVFLFYEKNA